MFENTSSAQGCYTSRGAVGRKYRKSKRYELRLARKYGQFPAPSVIEAKFAPPKRVA